MALLNWLLENKEWVFSGLGIFFLTILFHKRKERKKATYNQKIKSGDKSFNIQVNNK